MFLCVAQCDPLRNGYCRDQPTEQQTLVLLHELLEVFTYAATKLKTTNLKHASSRGPVDIARVYGGGMIYICMACSDDRGLF